MKFNWGTGITIFALAFVAFILNLVFRCSKEQVELVSESYYSNEIRFQERIDRQSNLLESGEFVKLVMSPDSLDMFFPRFSGQTELKGTIHFFRPDESSKDFTVPVSTNGSYFQSVAIADLKPGNWKVQIDFDAGGKPYYQEEKIWIQ